MNSRYIQARVDDPTWRWIRRISLESGLTIKALIMTALVAYAKANGLEELPKS